MRPLRSILVVALVASLSACGGDDDDGGVSLSPSAVTFTANENGAIPAPQDVRITLSRTDVTHLIVGMPPSSPTFPSWLQQPPTVTGSGQSWTMRLSVDEAPTAVGTRSATLRVVAARGTDLYDAVPLAYRDLTVTYVVSPP